MSDTNVIPTWTVSDRLRKAREKAGLDQDELAERIGINRATISRYERGITTPKHPALLAVAVACGVPLWWLEGHEEEGDTPSTKWYGVAA